MLAIRSAYHTSVPATTLVLYPNEPNVSFDESYYVNTHMPLLEKAWTKYGLKGWQVTKFTSNPDGSKPPHLICATLEWESIDTVRATFAGPGIVELKKDGSKVSNKSPTFLIGDKLQAPGVEWMSAMNR